MVLLGKRMARTWSNKAGRRLGVNNRVDIEWYKNLHKGSISKPSHEMICLPGTSGMRCDGMAYS